MLSDLDPKWLRMERVDDDSCGDCGGGDNDNVDADYDKHNDGDGDDCCWSLAMPMRAPQVTNVTGDW